MWYTKLKARTQLFIHEVRTQKTYRNMTRPSTLCHNRLSVSARNKLKNFVCNWNLWINPSIRHFLSKYNNQWRSSAERWRHNTSLNDGGREFAQQTNKQQMCAVLPIYVHAMKVNDWLFSVYVDYRWDHVQFVLNLGSQRLLCFMCVWIAIGDARKFMIW